MAGRQRPSRFCQRRATLVSPPLPPVPHPFTRTLRSLDADRSRLGAWMAATAVLLLTAWALWLALARVPVFAASREARLVTEHAVYALESPVSARVESVAAALDQRVEAGAVLFQLDDRSSRISRDEARHALLSLSIAGWAGERLGPSADPGGAGLPVMFSIP